MKNEPKEQRKNNVNETIVENIQLHSKNDPIENTRNNLKKNNSDNLLETSHSKFDNSKLNNRKIQNFKKIKKHDIFVIENRINQKIRHVLRTHEAFCVEDKIESKVDKFMENYQKIIDGINRKIEGNTIYEEFPFHYEIKLINEYTIMREYGDLRLFNTKLFDHNWTSKNEVLIVEFVKKKLENIIHK